MTKTYREISEAIEATNISPFAKDAFGFFLEAFVTDKSYDTAADAVEAMTDQLYEDKASIISVIKAVTDLQTWVVILRMDGEATLVLSREIIASNAGAATEKFITSLVGTGHVAKNSLTVEATYGPF
jgi:hypothetical protein